MKEYERLKLAKSELRVRLKDNDEMTSDELLRLNAHNTNDIRKIVNAFFVITIVLPTIFYGFYLLARG
jgi:hypothetical protein